jgi:hypothetical protein
MSKMSIADAAPRPKCSIFSLSAEEQAEIKDRFAQDLLGAEHKGDEESADSAVE